MTNSLALAASSLLVPGSGQVLLGRLRGGVLLACAWLLSAAGSVFVIFVWPEVWGAFAKAALGGVAIAIYIFCQAETFLLYQAANDKKRKEHADLLYKQACVDYLRGDFAAAREKLRQLLRNNKDDVDAHIQMAHLARAEGNADLARRWFKQAQFLDTDGKWDLDISRQ